MNGRERTISLFEGRSVEHVPIHPPAMQYAAELTDQKYRNFCTDYRQQSKAMMESVRNYD